MTEYVFDWWRSGATRAAPPRVRLQAESHLHGAALALREFIALGCDITAPLAHVDIVESNGAKRTLLVEEVFHWVHQPPQAEFIHREHLSGLLHTALPSD